MSSSAVNEIDCLIPGMALKERIKEAIDGARPKKSKAEIARACGVTNAAVTHWLDGETKSLKAEKALALEQVTGYRANWIANGKGPKRLADPAEPYWPFNKVPIERYEALEPEDKGYVQRRLLQAIQECEAEPDLTMSPEEERLVVDAHQHSPEIKRKHSRKKG
jgi:transcriptional regulator with XRE-family HTH domain